MTSRPTPPTACGATGRARRVGHRARRSRMPLHRRDDDPAGPAPIGSCGVAGSCCSRASRRRVCASARTRSAGGRRGRSHLADPLARRGSCGPMRTDDADGRSDDEAIPHRTALVAEIRDGLLHVYPAAHRGTRALRRPGHPRRGRGGKVDCPLVIEGYGPRRIPHHVDDHHARPRRHRGERRPDGQLRRAAGAARKRSTTRPGRPGCPPSPSTSTARTVAPAAATTSPWAASPPPTRRCCAGPTCWSRC